MNQILDEMVKEYEDEMPYHIDRWYQESIQTSQYTITSFSEWEDNVLELSGYLKFLPIFNLFKSEFLDTALLSKKIRSFT